MKLYKFRVLMIQQIIMAQVVSGLSAFFGEVSRLIDEANRQYGLANGSYTEYVIERLEFVVNVCSDLSSHMRAVAELEDYCKSCEELMSTIRVICSKWEEYQGVLDANLTVRPSYSYQSQVSTRLQVGPGRPPFEISREQLLYLSSMGFKWSEIAVLIGVSRMTIYRCKLHIFHA